MAKMTAEARMANRDLGSFFCPINKGFSEVFRQSGKIVSVFVCLTFLLTQVNPGYSQDAAPAPQDQTTESSNPVVTAADAEAQQQSSATGQIQSPAYQPPEETTTQDFMTEDSVLSSAEVEADLQVQSGDLAERKLAEAKGQELQDKITVVQQRTDEISSKISSNQKSADDLYAKFSDKLSDDAEISIEDYSNLETAFLGLREERYSLDTELSQTNEQLKTLKNELAALQLQEGEVQVVRVFEMLSFSRYNYTPPANYYSAEIEKLTANKPIAITLENGSKLSFNPASLVNTFYEVKRKVWGKLGGVQDSDRAGIGTPENPRDPWITYQLAAGSYHDFEAGTLSDRQERRRILNIADRLKDQITNSDGSVNQKAFVRGILGDVNIETVSSGEKDGAYYFDITPVQFGDQYSYERIAMMPLMEGEAPDPLSGHTVAIDPVGGKANIQGSKYDLKDEAQLSKFKQYVDSILQTNALYRDYEKDPWKSISDNLSSYLNKIVTPQIEPAPIQLIAPIGPVAPPVIAKTEEEANNIRNEGIREALKLNSTDEFKITGTYSNDAIYTDYRTGESSYNYIYEVAKSDGTLSYVSCQMKRTSDGYTSVDVSLSGYTQEGFNRLIGRVTEMEVMEPIRFAAPIVPVAPPVIAKTEEEQTELIRSTVANALGIGADEKFDLKIIYSNDAIRMNYQTGEQSIDDIYRIIKSDGSVLYASVNGARIPDGITSLSAGLRTDGGYFDKELQIQSIEKISIAPMAPVAPPVIAKTEEEQEALTRSTIANALNIGADEKFDLKIIYSNDAVVVTNWKTGEEMIDLIYRVTKPDGSILYAAVNGGRVADGITSLSAYERTDGKLFDRELQTQTIKSISLAPAPAPEPEPEPAPMIQTDPAITLKAADFEKRISALAEITLADFQEAQKFLGVMEEREAYENLLNIISRKIVVVDVAGIKVKVFPTGLIKIVDDELNNLPDGADWLPGLTAEDFIAAGALDDSLESDLSMVLYMVSHYGEYFVKDGELDEGSFRQWLRGENLEQTGTSEESSSESELKVPDESTNVIEPEVMESEPHLPVKDGERNVEPEVIEEPVSEPELKVPDESTNVIDPEVMETSQEEPVNEQELKVPDESTNVIEPEVMESEPELPVKDGERNVEPEVMEGPVNEPELGVPDESTNVIEPEVMETSEGAPESSDQSTVLEPGVMEVDEQKEVQELSALLDSDHMKQMELIGAKYSERLKALKNKFAGQSEISLADYDDIESIVSALRTEYETENKNYSDGRIKLQEYASSRNVFFVVPVVYVQGRKGTGYVNDEHRNIEDGVNELLASKSVGLVLEDGSTLHVNPALTFDVINKTRRDFGVQYGVEGQQLGEVPGIIAEDSKGIGSSADEWGTLSAPQNNRIALNVIQRLGKSVATNDGLVSPFALRKALLGGKPFESVGINEDADGNVRVTVKKNFGSVREFYLPGTEPAFMTMNAKDKKIEIGGKSFDISNRDNVVSALQAITDNINSNPLDRSSSEGDWRLVIEKFQDFVKKNSPATEKAKEVVAAFRAAMSSGGASGIPPERPGAFSSADRDRERKESALAERKANRLSLFELWQKQKRSKSRSSGARISGFEE